MSSKRQAEIALQTKRKTAKLRGACFPHIQSWFALPSRKGSAYDPIEVDDDENNAIEILEGSVEGSPDATSSNTAVSTEDTAMEQFSIAETPSGRSTPACDDPSGPEARQCSRCEDDGQRGGVNESTDIPGPEPRSESPHINRERSKAPTPETSSARESGSAKHARRPTTDPALVRSKIENLSNLVKIPPYTFSIGVGLLAWLLCCGSMNEVARTAVFVGGRKHLYLRLRLWEGGLGWPMSYGGGL